MKLTLSFLSAIVSITSLTMINNQFVYKTHKDDILLKTIIENIKSNASYKREEKYFSYQNEDYRNYNAIINKLAQPNAIQSIHTTSNPNNIIINYETGLLDQNKIYSTDFDEYVKVYKSALGKVVLPNCPSVKVESGCVVSDKSQIERTLDSYVNNGFITPEYSYSFDDDAQWYRTLPDAQNDYMNTNYVIKQSLFYTVNGNNYYNAFNPNDLNSLKLNQNIMHKGYRYYGDGTENDLDSFSVVQNDFKNVLQEKMYSLLTQPKQNVDNVFTSPGDLFVHMSGEGQLGLKISGDDQDRYLKAIKNFEFIITKLARDELGVDVNNLIETLKNSGGWETGENNPHAKVKTISIAKNIQIDLTLLNCHKETISAGASGGSCMNCVPRPTPPQVRDACDEPNPSSVTALVSENTPIGVEFNPQTKMKPFYNLIKDQPSYSLTSDLIPAIKNFTDALTNEVSIYSDEDEITNKIWSQGKISNWDPQFIKTIFQKYFDLNYNSIIVTNTDSQGLINLDWLKSDWLYGLSNETLNSFSEQMEYFKTNFLNSHQNLNPNDDLTLTGIGSNADSFTTTWENWSHNFYYLNQANDAPLFPLVKKYYIANSVDEDISEFSAPFSNTIADSPAQLFELMTEFDHSHPRKRYKIYDVNGKSTILDLDKDQALVWLKNQIALNYKLLSKKELANYQDQDADWNDVISDGEYTVYKLTNSKNQTFYFKSYEQALSMYVNSLVQTNEIKTETRLIYSYSIMLNGQLKTYEWWTNDQVEQIALEIMQNIKEMSDQ